MGINKFIHFFQIIKLGKTFIKISMKKILILFYLHLEEMKLLVLLRGLKDLSVSARKTFSWGVEVPNDKNNSFMFG